MHGGLWGRTYDTLGKRSPLESGEAQVTDLDGSRGPGDEDVVTLEIPVDDGRRPGMKEMKPFQDLPTPAAQNFDLHLLKPLQIPAEHNKPLFIMGKLFVCLFYKIYIFNLIRFNYALTI